MVIMESSKTSLKNRAEWQRCTEALCANGHEEDRWRWGDGEGIKHPAPDRVKPSFVIFDIQALNPEHKSVQMSKLQMTA